MSDSIQIREGEAQALSRYLVGKDCPDEIRERYAEAVSKLNSTLSGPEQKTWDKMISSRFYLKLLDSGLAIVNPQSNIRKRIFIMLALLEASPDFTDYFLPQQRTIFYLIPLGFRAFFSALYLVCGVVTVRVIGLK